MDRRLIGRGRRISGICAGCALRVAAMATLVPAVYRCLRRKGERARGCVDREGDFFLHLFVFEFLELQYLRSG